MVLLVALMTMIPDFRRVLIAGSIWLAIPCLAMTCVVCCVTVGEMSQSSPERSLVGDPSRLDALRRTPGCAMRAKYRLWGQMGHGVPTFGPTFQIWHNPSSTGGWRSGSALRSHRRGRGFEPRIAHQHSRLLKRAWSHCGVLGNRFCREWLGKVIP